MSWIEFGFVRLDWVDKKLILLLKIKPKDRWWYWKPDCNLFWENEYTVVLLFSLDEVWACPQCDVTSSYLPFWWWWWTQSCFSTLRLKNWSNGLYTTSFCTTFTAPTFLLTLRCPLIFLIYKMPLSYHFCSKFTCCCSLRCDQTSSSWKICWMKI